MEHLLAIPNTEFAGCFAGLAGTVEQVHKCWRTLLRREL